MSGEESSPEPKIIVDDDWKSQVEREKAEFRSRATQLESSRALEEMLVLPVAVPGLATALALIVTYGSLSGFRTSWAFILVGHVLFTLPFMVASWLVPPTKTRQNWAKSTPGTLILSRAVSILLSKRSASAMSPWLRQLKISTSAGSR